MANLLGEEKKFQHFGTLLGLGILILGAVVLAKLFNYLPFSLGIDDSNLLLGTAAGCVIAGLHMVYTGLTKSKPGY